MKFSDRRARTFPRSATAVPCGADVRSGFSPMRLPSDNVELRASVSVSQV
jgi:hypothetical protein